MKGIVVLSCWVLGALQGAILILVPEMMIQGQVSALELALPLALGTLIFVYSSGRWGTLLDSRVAMSKPLTTVLKWVLFGFVLSQLSFVSLLHFSGFQAELLIAVLCLSRILHGVFCSAIIPSAQLCLSQGDKQGEKLVWANIATNIGRLTAPLLTFLPVDIPYFSLWLIAAVTVVAWFFTLFIRELNRQLSQESETEENSKDLAMSLDIETGLEFTRNKLLICVCTTAVLISLFSSQLQFSLGPLLLNLFERAAQASEMTATLLFAASASALIALFILYKPLSRHPSMLLLTIALSFIAGTVLFVQQTYLIPAVMLISAALSMAPAWYTALAMRTTTTKKARTSAAVSQSHTLGNAFGGLLTGALLALGNSALFISFIVLMLMILTGWYLLYRHSLNGIESAHELVADSD